MNLFIQIINSQPINHPVLEENLVQVYGSVPEGWEVFIRTSPPPIGPYQRLNLEVTTYEKINGVWTDIWCIEEFTPEEKLNQQEKLKSGWANQPDAFNFTTWIFNEESCAFDPPVPEPVEEGKKYHWCGADSSWKLRPARPTEGSFMFDIITWQWVEVTTS